MQLGDTTRLPLIGTIAAGRFLIIDIIATGGMGTIYRAHQLSMGRQVALKLLGTSDARDPEFVERFIREAHATAQLRSPHTIVIHDFGRCEDGSMFIAMELLSGTSMDNLLKATPMHPARVRRLMMQVCLSLEEAHQRGLVHRDIKPSNLMVENEGTPEEFVKVLDFGLVKVIDNPDPNQMALTRPGTIHGTPPYMAPEMWSENVQIGPAVDIYALGATMFEMLTGKRAFMAKSIPALLHKHVSELPPHLPHPALMPYDAIIQRCLAKKVEDRYPTAKALRIDLTRVGSDEERNGLPPMEETDLIAGRGRQRSHDGSEPAVTPGKETWRMDGPQPQPTVPLPSPNATTNERAMSAAAQTEPGSAELGPPRSKLPVIGAAAALVSAVVFAVLITRPDPVKQPTVELEPPPPVLSVVEPPPRVEPPPPVLEPPPIAPPPPVKPKVEHRAKLSLVKAVALDGTSAADLLKRIEREADACVRDQQKMRLYVMVRPDGSLNQLRVQPENRLVQECLWSRVSSLRVPPFEGAGFATLMAELEP